MTVCGTAAVTELGALLRRYYQSRAVRERMAEFLGGKPGAVYITASDGHSSYSRPDFPSRLSAYLDRGLEVDRSLWGQQALIADIDLEYHNFDIPAAAWADPERAFRLQQPVVDQTLRILHGAGIRPLVLVSGRGYHFVWSVRRGSPAFQGLAEIGQVPSALMARYGRPHAPAGLRIDPTVGLAFAGLGLIVEFIAHGVLEACGRDCAVPVVPTAIEVGPGVNGREIVSFDLSEYGDPLYTRHIRLPFSAYLKPRQWDWLLGQAGAESFLPIFEIPLNGMNASRAIAVAREPRAVLELAQSVSVAIPDASEPMEELLNRYRASALAAFHERFHRQLRGQFQCPVEPAAVRVPQSPPCLRWPLEHPNDLLLKPAALQHVVRMLTALDWSPAAIAQAIWTAYRQDAGWGNIWRRIEPCQRGIFYTRLFAGLIATGTDKLIDMNCVSHQEKGFCGVGECVSNLVEFRDRLIEKSVA